MIGNSAVLATSIFKCATASPRRNGQSPRFHTAGAIQTLHMLVWEMRGYLIVVARFGHRSSGGPADPRTKGYGPVEVFENQAAWDDDGLTQ
jgi:hypothetical protein